MYYRCWKHVIKDLENIKTSPGKCITAPGKCNTGPGKCMISFQKADVPFM
jgi:hypothetical protein